MSLSRQYKTSKSRQEDGAPMRFPANDNGSVPTIFVRRIGVDDNEYGRVRERIFAPHRREQEVGVLPPALDKQLRYEAMAEGGIAKWENILKSDVTGKAEDTGFAPYTKENAVALLNNLPELYSELVMFGHDRSNFLASREEADAKN